MSSARLLRLRSCQIIQKLPIVSGRRELTRRTFSKSTSLRKEKQPRVTTSSGLPRPRLDYRNISENVQQKTESAVKRKAAIPDGTVQSVARLYQEHKQISATLNSKRNSRSKIGDIVRDSVGEAKKTAIDEAKSLKAEITSLEVRLAQVDEELYSLALAIPNDTHPDVLDLPGYAVRNGQFGLESNDAILEENPKRDHVAVGRALNLLDFEAAAVVTGSSWYYLLNEGAILEMALTRYAFDKAIEHGWKPVTTPDVVKADVAMRCGFQPRDQGDSPVQHMYHLQSATPGQAELVLSGTAEIPLAGLFANKIYEEGELPLKVLGIGKAFRSEAGARGADTRGLYRVHQFSKLELFSVCSQEKSEQMLLDMVKLQVEIFRGLGLPLRVLDMPPDELGASAYRKYDIEAWMPGRGAWGEISSTSNCTDYQARRLHIRYRRDSSADTSRDDAPLPFAHTLNGTAAAIPRLIVALLENGATFNEEGEVIGLTLPVALKNYWPKGEPRWLKWH